LKRAVPFDEDHTLPFFVVHHQLDFVNGERCATGRWPSIWGEGVLLRTIDKLTNHGLPFFSPHQDHGPALSAGLNNR
jgi:hypothetical protein